MAAARLQLVKNFLSRVRVIPGQILKLIGLKDADAESPWAEAYQGGGGTGVLSPQWLHDGPRIINMSEEAILSAENSGKPLGGRGSIPNRTRGAHSPP